MTGIERTAEESTFIASKQVGPHAAEKVASTL
jgi:hypothetical protein